MAGLLEPVRLGELECRNRIAMAPCTRCMSPGFLPTEAVAAYYERRAADGVGLLISEGTVICERGTGYPDVPGIFNAEQVEAWRQVTGRVHEAGGKIACQIWHVGAVAHPRTTGGVLPESPSGISPVGEIRRLKRPDGSHEVYGESVAVTEDRIHELIELYRQAARNSREAGFDAVEIHGAHGYLIDQFTNLHFNRREDDWGGENRTRFAHEVARAVIEEVGSGRTLMRISPKMSAAGTGWVRVEGTFPRLLNDLWEAHLQRGVRRADPSRLSPRGRPLRTHHAARRRTGAVARSARGRGRSHSRTGTPGDRGRRNRRGRFRARADRQPRPRQPGPRGSRTRGIPPGDARNAVLRPRSDAIAVKKRSGFESPAARRPFPRCRHIIF
jgi:2,4-dienoyl-CoA reductase-like NADH-dependent reductase (Old Yellow Enzyme family)